MSQALYRKYRPQKFSDIVGQEHVTKTLEAALKNGTLSHAYLFTGPRGVGKTSVARILAYAANDAKYGDGSLQLDIIEIDGASNRRIEEVRDLRDKVNITPSVGRFKVYIIDEAHMLTREAFNALLKTLEEPPAHCIFILATTEAHKLPETIISRAQRFNFRPLSAEVLAKSLALTAKKEGIPIEPEALTLLAEHGQGSFRDAVSLLDQMRSSGEKVDAASVREMVGLPPQKSIEELYSAVQVCDTKHIFEQLDRMRVANVSPAAVAKTLSQQLRMTLKLGDGDAWVVELLKQLLEVAASNSPQDRLEIALAEASSRIARPNSEIQEPPVKLEPAIVPDHTNVEPTSKPTSQPRPTSPKKSNSKFSAVDWPKLLTGVKAKNTTLALALKHGLPVLNKDKLELVFEFGLYKKKVDTSSNRRLVSQIIEDNFSDQVTVTCLVDKSLYGELANKNSRGSVNQAQTISNIFGSSEVLESPVSI